MYIKLNERFDNFELIDHLDCIVTTDNHRLCTRSSIYGYLSLLKYSANHKGFQWDQFTTCYAAEYGNLDCLIYAHKNGCKFTKNATYFAAINGHLDCLKYLTENGYYFDKFKKKYLTEDYQLECLRYIEQNV